MKKYMLLALMFAAVAPMAHADFSPVVEHDSRYVYYRTAWTHLSKEDQVKIIDASIELLKNEISDNTSKIPGLKKLSNTILASNVLDKLVGLAQQSVTILDDHGWRNLLPSGIFVFGGGSVNAGFLVNVKGSADIGLVIVPTEVTRVDTQTLDSETYFSLDWNLVGIPHGYAGIGVGAGASGSAGAGLIWGNLNKAADFVGPAGAISADVKIFAGAEIEFAGVHNTTTGQSFGLGIVEYDWGAEAGASADASAGWIFSLGQSGTKSVPTNTPTISSVATIPPLPPPTNTSPKE